MKTVIVLAAAGAALLIAACSTAPRPPATAAQLAHRIPGTYSCTSLPPPASASGDEQCMVHDGGGVIQVATFTNGASETGWIGQSNSYACCVQGHGWAATYNFGTGSPGFSVITKAIGGRVVN